MAFRTLPTWEFPLYQGDDQARLLELDRAVQAAEARVEKARKDVETARLGDTDVSDNEAAVASAKAAFDAFVDEVAERTPMVRLSVLGSGTFHNLVLAHQPRQVKSTDAEGVETETDHADDAAWGVNTETFPLALLAFNDGTERTIVDPDHPSQAACEEFLRREVTEGEREQMWIEAYTRNKSGAMSPKSLARYGASPVSS